MNKDDKAIEKVEKLKAELVHLDKKDYLPSDILWSQQKSEDNRLHLRDYLEILLRRKWYIIVFLITVVITVTIASFLIQPSYKAILTLRINKEDPNILAFTNDYKPKKLEADYYVTQYEILKSRNLAKRVIKKLPSEKESRSTQRGLFLSAIHFLAKSISISKEEDKREGEETGMIGKKIDSLLKKLEVQPIKSSQLVNVIFKADNPVFAAHAANTIADEYIKFLLESKLEPSQQAGERLEKEVQAMRANLESSENQLNEYIARSQIIFLNQNKDYENLLTNKLSELSNALDKATTDRISKEAIYKEVKKSGVDYSVVLQNPLIQSLTMEYTKLESEYFNLLKIHKAEYPKMLRLEKQIEQIKNRIGEEEQRIINTLDADYKIALKKEMFLSYAIDNLRQNVIGYQQKMIHYQILKREVETNRALYNSLLQRHKEIGVGAALTDINVTILDRAEVPRKPYKPNKKMNILLSLFVGLFGGVFLAFFVEYFDNSVKTVDDVEKRSRLPVLGMVPIAQTNPSEIIGADSNGSGPFAEAFKSISTYIQFANPQKPPKQILVTSPLQQDGKTLSSVNLAKSFGKLFGKGIIIDADLRRPSIHRVLQLDNSKGLSSVLAGTVDYNKVIKKVANLSFDVITSGPVPPDASKIISSSRMRELIDTLTAKYDYVIIDSAPILGMSDSLILTQLIESVLLVVKASNTPRDALSQTIKLLDGVNANILGVVLNGLNIKTNYGYSYGNSYYYPSYSADKKEV
jgi:capsular exopolysaccharide synthesis family protein